MEEDRYTRKAGDPDKAPPPFAFHVSSDFDVCFVARKLSVYQFTSPVLAILLLDGIVQSPLSLLHSN